MFDALQDISLSDLSAYLTRLAEVSLSLVNPTLFIVNEFGSLIATSDPSQPLQLTAAQGQSSSRKTNAAHPLPNPS